MLTATASGIEYLSFIPGANVEVWAILGKVLDSAVCPELSLRQSAELNAAILKVQDASNKLGMLLARIEESPLPRASVD